VKTYSNKAFIMCERESQYHSVSYGATDTFTAIEEGNSYVSGTPNRE